MIQERYQWQLPSETCPAEFLAVCQDKQLSPVAAAVCYQRGIDNADSLDRLLKKDLAGLHDPFLFYDMEKATKRLHEAISADEKILVYGDYDADGMTSASIMKEALEMVGASFEVYLPNRFTDGYGPNASVYKYFIEQKGISVIVTVDNGVAGHEALAYAKAQGVDVIVTDHHGLPEVLPEAYAIIHPKHPKGNYPFADLAGCGVAFKLACAFLETTPFELLDLVAIGTIADMVRLTDENRLMVSYGLELLKQTERFGLMALYRLSHLSAETVTEETIGFTLAPQLNALGRLDDPNPALDLLTGFDDSEAEELAQLVFDKNTERKALVASIMAEAQEMVDLSKPVQVLAKADWHPGVLGIVAGRLVEIYQQPIIVLGLADGIAKGSARSVAGFDLFDLLSHKTDLFIAFGGHAGAAGMTLLADNCDRLSAYLCDAAKKKNLASEPAQLLLDGVLDSSDLTLKTVTSLRRLAPFGMGFLQPTFLLKEITVTQSKAMGQNNRHLKFTITKADKTLDIIAFDQGHLAQDFQQVDGLELAVQLSVNHWQGEERLQLLLIDARVDGIQLYDRRSKSATIPEELSLLSDETAQVVLVDQIPETLKKARQLFCGRDLKAVYFKNRIEKPYYLTGAGSHRQFANLYKVLSQQEEIDVRHKLGELSRFLRIEPILLVKMIQIFEELAFITLSDGIMRRNSSAPKRDLSESQIYRALKEDIAYQELMALASPKVIYETLTEPVEKATI